MEERRERFVGSELGLYSEVGFFFCRSGGLKLDRGG